MWVPPFLTSGTVAPARITRVMDKGPILVHHGERKDGSDAPIVHSFIHVVSQSVSCRIYQRMSRSITAEMSDGPGGVREI